MKKFFPFSLLLNLLLLGGLVDLLINHHRKEVAPSVAAAESKPPSPTLAQAAVSAPSPAQPQPFCWSQLESGNDYRTFIANLRAIGCPEATIQDIVAGNVGRAFAWKRAQLRLDGSGTGPWSQVSEQALVANLLGRQSPVAAASAPLANEPAASSGMDETGASASSSAAPVYPLFVSQNVDWGKMGFDPGEQAAIVQARQQFLSDLNGPAPGSDGSALGNNNALSSNPNDPGFIQRWQTALQNANDTLQTELGNQDFATYEMQQYYEWFKPQVPTAYSGGNLKIDVPNYVPQ